MSSKPKITFVELTKLARKYKIPTTKKNKNGKYGKTKVTVKVLKSRLTRAGVKYTKPKRNRFGDDEEDDKTGPSVPETTGKTGKISPRTSIRGGNWLFPPGTTEAQIQAALGPPPPNANFGKKNRSSF